MTLAHFGYGTSEVTTDSQGRPVGGVKLTIWDAVTGGSQITDLYDYTTGATLPGYVTSDALGRFGWQANDAFGALFADDGNPDHSRWRVSSLESVQMLGPALASAQEATRNYQAVLDLVKPGDGSRPLPVFDVDLAGAKGDASTDDTAAFQSAATSAKAAGGGIVRLSPGKTYVLNGFVDISGGNIWVIGYGAKVKKLTGRASYGIFVALSHGKAGYGSAGFGFRISGLTVVADGGTGACLFSGHHADNVTIEDCVMLGALSAGHAVDLGGCRYVTVTRCRFAGRLTGSGRNEAIQVDVSADGSLSVADDAGSFDGLPTQHVTVADCSFTKWTDPASGTTYPAPMPFGAHGTPGSGGAAGVGMFYDGLHFIRNYCESSESNPLSNPRGLVHFIAARHLTISDNIFTNPDGADVPAVGIFDTSDVPGTGRIRCADVTISGNRFTGVMPTQSQVLLSQVDSVKVIDNTGVGIGGGSAAAVQLTGCKRIFVRGNDLSAGAGTQATGIAVDSTSTTGRVESNIATGFTAGVSNSSTTVTAANNITA